MSPHRTTTRRDFVKAGALPMLGMGLAEVLQAQATGASRRQAKSVLFVFLSGGVSHQDTWDMKPDADSQARGEFNPMATRTSGLQLCEHMPLLAQRTRQLAFVRSLKHHSNNHEVSTYMVLTGNNEIPAGFKPRLPSPVDKPSIATVAHVHLKSDRPEVPSSVILPQLIIHQTAGVMRPGQLAGMLGAHNNPWVVKSAAFCTGFGNCPDCFHYQGKTHHHAPGPLWQTPQNMQLPPDLSMRFPDRVSLLKKLEAQQEQAEKADALGAFAAHRRRAFSILSSGRTQRAFDMDREPERVKDAYGRHLFGRSFLLARRLLEAGVRLVQVNLGNLETWDTHWKNFPFLKKLLPPLDQSLSALLDDLKASGLLDETLIVLLGEFGRTAKINKNGGRDHWGQANTVLFAGGGVQGGKVIGATDKRAAFVVDDPYAPADIGATIYRALGIDPHMEIHDTVGRPFPLNEGKIIDRLYS